VTSPPTSVNPEDRLFHLILALMSTTQGLLKEQILSTVRGYREDTERGMSRESLERRFERDKDALRELGIPLEATIPPEDDGNNKNTLYRIPKGDYHLPANIEFTTRDVALLNLAAAVWREGSLSQEARVASVKLASYGAKVDEPLIGFAPIISTRDPALRALREAIEKGVQVSFDYLKPGESDATKRTVSPFALVNHEGRWHLFCHETSSAKEKTFLLRRIVSSVRLVNSPAHASADDVAQRAVDELEAVYQANVAHLLVEPGSDAFAVLMARRGTTGHDGHLAVHFTDPDIFADDVTSLGKDVVVLEPDIMVQKVRRRLEELVAHHG